MLSLVGLVIFQSSTTSLFGVEFHRCRLRLQSSEPTPMLLVSPSVQPAGPMLWVRCSSICDTSRFGVESTGAASVAAFGADSSDLRHLSL